MTLTPALGGVNTKEDEEDEEEGEACRQTFHCEFFSVLIWQEEEEETSYFLSSPPRQVGSDWLE